MPNQTDSPDGKPAKSEQRPSPDVDRHATDGQSDARGQGASDSGRIDKAPGAGLSDRNGPSDPETPHGPGSDAS